MIFLLSALIMFASPAFAFDHTYGDWGKFLKQYVVAGEHASHVKYKEAEKDPHLLNNFVNEIEAVKKSEYDSWSVPQKEAFLINSYNALTIKWILQNHIPKSIKDTGKYFLGVPVKSPWKMKFFTLFGKKTYLDHIEQDLARKHFVNCRFHFAFNCASIGCPMLRPEPWLPEKLDQQFDDSARRYLTDTSRNVYDAKSNSLNLSKIFDWYGDDFKKDKTCGGSVRAFVTRYIQAPDGKPVPASANIKYLDYNWNLND